MTGDYAPHRRRALMIMLSFTGAPIGGFLCGQAAGLLLPTLGWPSIFVIGGVVPLALVVVMALWLPESPRILAAKLEHWPKVDRENLHEFRKGVRELRDMLQLLSHLGEQPLPAFDGVKDRTGEWHDWQELECIATSVLDPDGGDAGLLREIRMIVRGKFDAALAEARALQKRNLLTAAAA